MDKIPIYDATAPIACTIGTDEIPDRIELVERIRAKLTTVERTPDGLLLHLPATPSNRADLERFAIDEKRCCQFWGFTGHGRHRRPNPPMGRTTDRPAPPGPAAAVLHRRRTAPRTRRTALILHLVRPTITCERIPFHDAVHPKFTQPTLPQRKMSEMLGAWSMSGPWSSGQRCTPRWVNRRVW